jgi:hypothetical protein
MKKKTKIKILFQGFNGEVTGGGYYRLFILRSETPMKSQAAQEAARN